MSGDLYKTSDSLADGADIPPPPPPRKSVSFDNSVKVILIPTKLEFRNAGIAGDVWWQPFEYDEMKMSAAREIQEVINSHCIDPRAAMKILYQPETATTTGLTKTNNHLGKDIGINSNNHKESQVDNENIVESPTGDKNKMPDHHVSIPVKVCVVDESGVSVPAGESGNENKLCHNTVTNGATTMPRNSSDHPVIYDSPLKKNHPPHQPLTTIQVDDNASPVPGSVATTATPIFSMTFPNIVCTEDDCNHCGYDNDATIDRPGVAVVDTAAAKKMDSLERSNISSNNNNPHISSRSMLSPDDIASDISPPMTHSAAISIP